MMRIEFDDWGLNQRLAEYDAAEFRIWAPDLRTYCLVDEIDYQFALEYRWCIKRCKYNLQYFRRAVGVTESGVRIKTFSVYLHVEIMKRKGVEPPAPNWNRVDHRDGDTMNNRRSNLRWATYRQNRINVRGSHSHDFDPGMFS